MKRTPGLWTIVLAILLIVTLSPTDPQMLMWDVGLMPLGRTRQHRNPRRNRERWARRLAAQRRRRPLAPKQKRRMKRPVSPRVTWAHHKQTPVHIRTVSKRRAPQKAPAPAQRIGTADPLADLRQGRGLIDLIEERTLWAMLRRIVWPEGPVCPHCGEKELDYLKPKSVIEKIKG